MPLAAPVVPVALPMSFSIEMVPSEQVVWLWEVAGYIRAGGLASGCGNGGHHCGGN